MITSYSYQNGVFTPTVIDLGEPDPGQEWDKHLRSCGWISIGRMPTHSEWEMVCYAAWLWRREDGPLCLVELTYQDTGIAQILCPDMSQLLLLQRDVLLPMMSHGDRDLLVDKLTHACHCLFDQKNGLQCAQRVQNWDDYQRQKDREERQQREAQKRAKAG